MSDRTESDPFYRWWRGWDSYAAHHGAEPNDYGVRSLREAFAAGAAWERSRSAARDCIAPEGGCKRSFNDPFGQRCALVVEAGFPSPCKGQCAMKAEDHRIAPQRTGEEK